MIDIILKNTGFLTISQKLILTKKKKISEDYETVQRNRIGSRIIGITKDIELILSSSWKDVFYELIKEETTRILELIEQYR